MIKIGYDAGHGLNTLGKRTPDDEREWSFNNVVATAFAEEMANYENVKLLRTDDSTGKTDVPLKIRTDKANAWGADVYISFHHNANTGKWGNWTGIETHVYIGNTNTNSGKLAKLVQPALVKAYGLRDRGIKESNFHIVRETKMPAILIEGGFMDSVIDIKKLRDDNVLKNAGIAVAQAVAEYANLKRKESEDELTMSQYQELKNKNEELKKDITNLKEMILYGTNETPSNWAKKDWEEAVANGYFDGTRPGAPITREEVAIVINRLRRNFKQLHAEENN